MDSPFEERTEGDALAVEPQPASGEPIRTGLRFAVASSLEHVLGAWRLVYASYRRIGLIKPNPYRIHTRPQAPRPDTVVIGGWIRGRVVSTATCIRDHGRGLPLDSEYKPQLDQLRGQGRKLSEIGLLADRREQISRITDSLLMLMHYVYDYAFTDGGTDLMIGVHPRHSRFYMRLFGFELFGSERRYAAVNDRPVVLLRRTQDTGQSNGHLPRGLQYFRDHPLPIDAFQHRFDFNPAEVDPSPIGQFIRTGYASSQPPPSDDVESDPPRQINLR